MNKKNTQNARNQRRKALNRRRGVFRARSHTQHCVTNIISERDENADECVVATPGKAGSLPLSDNPSAEKTPTIPAAEKGGGSAARVADSLMSQTRTEWVLIQKGESKAWIPRRELAFEARNGLSMLKAAGVLLFGHAEQKQLITDVAGVTSFPERVIIETSGWNGIHFALPDGTIFSPPTEKPPLCVVAPSRSRIAVRGNSVGWRRNVAEPLAGYVIPEFMFCLPFSAPLIGESQIEGNFGFDLSGASSTGKSTIERAVATTVGPVVGRDGRYTQSWNTTVNGLEMLLPFYKDLPIVLDELTLALGNGSRKNQEVIQQMIMRLADGVPRRRAGDEVGAGIVYNTVFLSSSNRDLRSSLGALTRDEVEAALVRFIQIPVPRTPSGVFGVSTDETPNALELLASLDHAVARYYGSPMRRFLQELVAQRARDLGAFQQWLSARIEHFLTSAKVKNSSGADIRVAKAFGLTAAAGDLAQSYGVLPESFRPQASALACFDLHRTTLKQSKTIVERLSCLFRDNDFFDVRAGKLPTLSDLDMEERGRFIARGVRGRTEVWLSEGAFRAAFPDRIQVLGSIEAEDIMITEKKRKGGTYRTYRRARQNRGPERVYCFQVPSNIV